MKKILVILFVFFLGFFVNYYNQPVNQVYDFLEHGVALGSEFSQSEISHMKDVKFIFDVMKWVFVALLISLYFCKDVIFSKVGIEGLSFIIVMGLVGLIKFNLLFDLMHKLLFKDGTWMFSSSSTLIQLYPLQFFITFFFNWMIYCGLWFTGMIIVEKFIMKPA